MEKFRKTLRDLYTGEKISITPLAFIIRAVVKALKDYPNFNDSLDLKKEKIIYKKFKNTHLSFRKNKIFKNFPKNKRFYSRQESELRIFNFFRIEKN